MKATIPNFGELNINSLEEYYQQEILLNEKKLNLDLNFTESEISEDRIQLVTHVLNNLNHVFNQVREYMEVDFKKGEVVNEYIEFHFEEMFEDELELLLKDANKNLTQQQ